MVSGNLTAYPLSRVCGGEGRGERDASRLPSHASPEVSPQGATRTRFRDGRWHFQHGPIDLIIGANGEREAVETAVEQAWQRFQLALPELVSELPMLRLPVQDACDVRGPVAKRMVSACWPHRERFITPMAAVAGAVADEMIAFFCVPGVLRAYVNNGGDIAVHLTPGQAYRVGLIADPGRPQGREALGLDGDFEVTADLPVRGIATSGWRGRSFSLGIADSVTVLARSAAEADAAATMIANSVDVDTSAIVRRPASELKDDTDLGDRLVTVDVGPLSTGLIERALAAGEGHAQRLLDAGSIAAAVMCLCGRARAVPGVAVLQPAPGVRPV